jgi:hypothetical protein
MAEGPPPRINYCKIAAMKRKLVAHYNQMKKVFGDHFNDLGLAIQVDPKYPLACTSFLELRYRYLKIQIYGFLTRLACDSFFSAGLSSNTSSPSKQ